MPPTERKACLKLGVVVKERRNVPAFWKNVNRFTVLTRRVPQRWCSWFLSWSIAVSDKYIRVNRNTRLDRRRAKERQRPQRLSNIMCLQPDVSDSEPISIQENYSTHLGQKMAVCSHYIASKMPLYCGHRQA